MTWAIREKGYSLRRASGPVGLHPKTYRHASKRTGDEDLRASRANWLRCAGSAIANSGCSWLAGASDPITRSAIGSTADLDQIVTITCASIN